MVISCRRWFLNILDARLWPLDEASSLPTASLQRPGVSPGGRPARPRSFEKLLKLQPITALELPPRRAVGNPSKFRVIRGEHCN